jgi:hypothetical protein
VDLEFVEIKWALAKYYFISCAFLQELSKVMKLYKLEYFINPFFYKKENKLWLALMFQMKSEK